MAAGRRAYGGLAPRGVEFYETAHWLTRRAGMPDDGGPLGRRRGLGRLRQFKRPSLDGGVLRGREIFSRGFVQMNVKAIMAAFCAPLPAPLPMVALVAGRTCLEETRLHSYHGSASRGDEGKSQRQFAC